MKLSWFLKGEYLERVSVVESLGAEKIVYLKLGENPFPSWFHLKKK
ncbi:MAG: hypothetical protein CM1200mP30_20890 [Pseudomonadota bacterium]|nr:MAG: hypothetical protein CM1200mP30_20890 [Pseudomonadota bacterium]